MVVIFRGQYMTTYMDGCGVHSLAFWWLTTGLFIFLMLKSIEKMQTRHQIRRQSRQCCSYFVRIQISS
jgi:hypothetical protein